jgi:hypothetical protein
MMFTLLLVALAVSGVGALVGRRSRFGQVLVIVGIVSLGVISVFQIKQIIFPAPEKTPDRGGMVVGSYLAKCVISDLGGESGTVILLFPSQSVMDADTEQSYEDGFVMPFHHAKASFHMKALHLDGKPGKAGYDLAAFQQILQQAPDALAIVSYAGMPVGCENLFSAAQPTPPVFYVYDAAVTTNWLPQLKDGHIKAVVLPRPGIDAHARAEVRGRPEDVFDQFYLLATQATADQVADQIAKK